jgi:hypothetical protein
LNPLPNHIYANGEDLGAGLVISTRNPLVYSRVVLYDDFYAMSKALKDKPPLAYVAIPGYSIALIFGGILGMEGKVRLTSQDDIKVIEAVLNAQGAWYHKNKIERHKSRFRRYEI